MNIIAPDKVATTHTNRRTGRLDLEFSPDCDGRTYLDRQFASYPFHICRPHYLDTEVPEMATLYTQSSAGGIFCEDNLNVQIVANANTKIHLTTQASTVVHSMEHGEASQTMTVTAHENALVEYLPDPSILFPQAKFTSTIELKIDDGAKAILGDAFLAHDPEQKDDPFGYFASTLRIRNAGGNILALDRFHVDGANFNNKQVGVMGGHRGHGTLVAIVPKEIATDLSVALANALSSLESVYAGVSTLPDESGVWIRYTAVDGAALTRTMVLVWTTVRQAITGHSPQPRRK